MKPIDWKLLLDHYKGKWVALKSDDKSVIAFGKNGKLVYEQAIKKGEKVPTLLKVPTASVPFVG